MEKKYLIDFNFYLYSEWLYYKTNKYSEKKRMKTLILIH